MTRLDSFSPGDSSQHKDLGGEKHDDEHSGEDCLQRKGVFSKGLDDVIRRFLNLVFTPCILGEGIIEVQPDLD